MGSLLQIFLTAGFLEMLSRSCYFYASQECTFMQVRSFIQPTIAHLLRSNSSCRDPHKMSYQQLLTTPLDAWKHFSVSVWDRTRVLAPGHNVPFAIAPHAASYTRHAIAQICQQSQSRCSLVYPHAHTSRSWTLEVHLASMTTVVAFHSCSWTWTSDDHNLCLIIWVIWSYNNNYVGIIIDSLDVQVGCAHWCCRGLLSG